MTSIIVNELKNWNNVFILFIFVVSYSYIVIFYIDNDAIYK